jgi:hypothetical protein
MFLLPKKEQATYLRQFMIDLSRDDAETAVTQEARETILHTDERRGRASRAGKASSESKATKVQVQPILNTEPAWMDETD